MWLGSVFVTITFTPQIFARMNVQYNEFKPAPSLSAYVEGYWLVKSDLPAGQFSAPNICIPKGTIELIVNLEGGKSEVYQDGKWVTLDRVMLLGIQSNPITWRMPGQSSKFGIRLKPETFINLFDTPVASLYQKFISLESLVGNRFSWLISMLREAPDTESRISIAESFLHKKLTAVKEGNQLITQAIRKIWMEDGNISTASLSKSVYIGERQLQRLFKSSIGISPKLYSRIIRFRSAFEQAQSGKFVAWTDVAYEMGYSDQAHFVKDFKTFTGVTPTALFN